MLVCLTNVNALGPAVDTLPEALLTATSMPVPSGMLDGVVHVITDAETTAKLVHCSFPPSRTTVHVGSNDRPLSVITVPGLPDVGVTESSSGQTMAAGAPIALASWRAPGVSVELASGVAKGLQNKAGSGHVKEPVNWLCVTTLPLVGQGI